MLNSEEDLKEVEFGDGLGESLILGDQEKELSSSTEFKHKMQVVFLKKKEMSVSQEVYECTSCTYRLECAVHLH